MKKCKGSFTIEATIVMSSIIVILFAILFAFSILYQQCLVSYVASKQVEEASASWITDNDLYYQIGEKKDKNTGTKISKIEENTLQVLKSASALGGKIDVKAEFENKLTERNLKITIEQNVIVPFEMIAKFFNKGNPMKIKATATTKIVEPTEYIRNIDYFVEIVSTIADWVGEKLKGIDVIKDITTILEKLG